MKACVPAILITAVSISVRASSGDAERGLPSDQTARTILNSTPRHREWVNVPMGKTAVLGFVVYPERSDTAPVVVVTEKNNGASNWIRAVSDQVAANGFIAVVPEVLTGLGPQRGDTDSFTSREAVVRALAQLGNQAVDRRIEAVRQYAIALPAA